MGTILASAIIDRVELELHDTGNVRWAANELFEHLKSGERQICALKRDAYVVNDVYQLVAGIKQTVPDGTSNYQNPSAETLNAGLILKKLIRNMGTDGVTAGNSIRLITLEALEAVKPDWPSTAASATVLHYMYDPETDPKHFYVYPPQPGSSQGYIEAAFGAIPTAISSISSAINLDDTYDDALFNWVLHKAVLKDNDDTFGFEMSQMYYNLFLQSLGIMEREEKKDNPKRRENTNG